MEFSESKIRRQTIQMIKEAEYFKFNKQYRVAMSEYWRIIFNLQQLIESPQVSDHGKEIYRKILIDVSSWIVSLQIHSKC